MHIPKRILFLKKLDTTKEAIFSFLVTLVAFGLVQRWVESLALTVLYYWGFNPQKGAVVIGESVLGIQILAFIACLNLSRFVSGFFFKRQDTQQSTSPSDSKTFLDYLFMNFLRLSVWLALGIFGGFFLCESSLLLFRSDTESFVINLLSFAFFSGVFFVWYYYLFSFRSWVMASLRSLPITKLSAFVTVVVLEALIWVKVLGFQLESFSGFKMDLLSFFVSAFILAFLNCWEHFFKFEKSAKKENLYVKKIFSNQVTRLFILIYVLGFPLGKFDQPSLLKIFPGPFIDAFFPTETMSALSTFKIQELFLLVMLCLSNNTLLQSLAQFFGLFKDREKLSPA